VKALKTLQLLLDHASLHTSSTYLNAVRLEPQLLSGSLGSNVDEVLEHARAVIAFYVGRSDSRRCAWQNQTRAAWF
jgi:hypothetical protein